ncbi:MAG: HAD-IIIA family hydrolase, partial [Thermoprotei archaeon]
RLTKEEFEQGRTRLRMLLAERGAQLDGEYYCLHHPDAENPEYRVKCECRKPRPGLLLQAAAQHGVDLSKSYMVGDDLNDVRAGQAAGCKTILISHTTALLIEILQKEKLRPHHIEPNITQAAHTILQDGERGDNTIKHTETPHPNPTTTQNKKFINTR